MKKIIYIKYSPLTRKVYEDYCMGVLLANGYEVEYWDVTKMFGIKLNDFESYNPQNGLVIEKIDSYQEMNSHLKEKENSFFISMMTCCIGQAKMLRLMTKHHCKMAFWGPDPVYIPQKSISNKVYGITLRKIKTKLGNELMKLLFKTGYLCYYDFRFNVGLKGFWSIGVLDGALLKKSQVIDINSSDYSNYNYSCFKRIVKNDYIVFIDQYLPFHPDFAIMGTSTLPASSYYDSLNNFFAKIEKKFNMPIVIAAHPKSLRYKEEDFFDGRKVYFGMTGPLVKDASLVLAHDSTAIGYAIMARKPIALMESSLMKSYLPRTVLKIRDFSSRFSLPLVNLDNASSILNVMQIKLTDEQYKLYESYIYDYCTSSTISEKNELLVLEFVQKVLTRKEENGKEYK